MEVLLAPQQVQISVRHNVSYHAVVVHGRFAEPDSVLWCMGSH